MEAILNAINSNKELVKAINKVGYYSVDNFIDDAKRYVLAISENRMLCRIHSVSKSGMSRVLSFHEFNVFNQPEGDKRGQIYNFYSLFEALGYRISKNTDGFTIGGCGMNMIFHTNYTIIHRLERLGFITEKECSVLCQKTPVTL